MKDLGSCPTCLQGYTELDSAKSGQALWAVSHRRLCFVVHFEHRLHVHLRAAVLCPDLAGAAHTGQSAGGYPTSGALQSPVIAPSDLIHSLPFVFIYGYDTCWS